MPKDAQGEKGRSAAHADDAARAGARDRTHDREPQAGHDDRGDSEGGKFFPDLLRRALTVGFTGVFMTEEAIRRALGDSVPRDVVEFILEQSERTRTELLERLSREFGRRLSAMDPVEIARRLLDGRTVEVTARLRLVSDDEDTAKKAADS